MNPTSAENQQAPLALIFEHPRKISKLTICDFSGLPLLHPAILWCKFNTSGAITKRISDYFKNLISKFA